METGFPIPAQVTVHIITIASSVLRHLFGHNRTHDFWIVTMSSGNLQQDILVRFTGVGMKTDVHVRIEAILDILVLKSGQDTGQGCFCLRMPIIDHCRIRMDHTQQPWCTRMKGKTLERGRRPHQGILSVQTIQPRRRIRCHTIPMHGINQMNQSNDNGSFGLRKTRCPSICHPHNQPKNFFGDERRHPRLRPRTHQCRRQLKVLGFTVCGSTRGHRVQLTLTLTTTKMSSFLRLRMVFRGRDCYGYG
mmetsp:Transcript_52585/g.58790  ORF Transcript_52585/g.58790 Transcript_52585/m.58790 type:complete len:248 (-) Transcript_52585:119-862(-)